ncbi:hypothetical protein BLNAU_1371 [Blattamonas nauphoetae]|uniref:Uncharacterized protein n=1 Tax=Blattamonas nauphoetae TaxID=2049346 RepID=A0ABQ9XCD2_9EUKA|nr:hypothetical protein BLNAU_19581 [Blattamonas nauphoetae]KAK2949591.1 hypothetical protein BLNAU_15451 [Blattamonas nauphoetae]KAK2957214.1 hypothetical protein BLNAU_7808 [Blattamonas nauphoetae]KAK2957780.1 hypothetical protein BLNAU_7214 [Blattamonas nauphoetae]KAK2962671.1 hypothetical protein BLNAU_2504 [Blattamonas nauphoetae]
MGQNVCDRERHAQSTTFCLYPTCDSQHFAQCFTRHPVNPFRLPVRLDTFTQPLLRLITLFLPVSPERLQKPTKYLEKTKSITISSCHSPAISMTVVSFKEAPLFL